MGASSGYFLEKASQCRRLAASLTDDKAIAALLKLAEEFEARAEVELTRERTEEAIEAAEGAGDDAGESAAENVIPIKRGSED